jgi:superfamily II DNA or RNA helicase/HKD family nuclease
MAGPLADGLYEQVVTGALAVDLASLQPERRSTVEPLDTADSHSVLARHLAGEVERTLAAVPHADRLNTQVAIVNGLLDELHRLAASTETEESADTGPRGKVEPSGRELLAVYRTAPYERPRTPLASSTLLTRNRAEPSLGGELAREVASADRIDVLVAFITVGGVRLLRDALEAFARRSTTQTRLRVLTTVFTQTTELEAIELLALLPGAEVKVSYDTRRTRLHAKAWLFHRDTGLHTAYVGSANFTSAALGGGQEWMVKACAADLPHVIEKFKGTFESLWHDSEFECFDPSDDASRSRLRAALAPADPRAPQVLFALRPFPFQEEILDRLATERRVHGRYRNLVVAATGTGKTVVAAFDYARQVGSADIPPRLLFLAHRREILEQALVTFRQALHDGAFGELLTGHDEPVRWDYVFATIQSVCSGDILRRFGPEYFQFVVVDECHHAPAEQYRTVVPHLKPHILLGLTATPERADGKSLLPDFDGHIAAELRIWHALDRQLLVPFEYYGVSDNTDLSRVRWTRNGYDQAALTDVYTGNDARADLIVKQLQRRVANLRSIRAVAFCVSVDHAEFMAKAFTARGVPALAVHGETPSAKRTEAPGLLRRREVNILCTCDLYNEGVDLPYVDTLLLLRPTQSATLFLQQLGRGLRLDRGKSSCVVLDFIGQHRSEFRFDTTLSALTGIPRARLLNALKQGLPLLPSGCAFQLDLVARDQILRSLQGHLARRQRIVDEAREIAGESTEPLTLARFLDATGRDLEDVYAAGGWTTVRRAARLITDPDNESEDATSARLGRLLHVDEPTRLSTWLRTQGTPVLLVSDIDRARVTMLSIQLEPRGIVPSHDTTAKRFSSPNLQQELRELCEVLSDRIPLPDDVFPEGDWPLALHRHYSRFEIAAAVGYKRPGDKAGVPQAGIFKLPAQRELLFITLDKSAKSFSPTTRYRDYAISPDRFHWETQSIASVQTESGKRYIESPENGWRFFLFVRTDPEAPFAFCGPATYLSHEGDRPIAITWHLEHPLPATLYQLYATLEQG